MRSKHAPSRDIDGQGEPRAPDGPSMHRINDNDVRQRMIHLDQFKRRRGSEFSRSRSRNRLGFFRAQAAACDVTGIEGSDPCKYAAARRRGDAEFPTALLHIAIDFLHRGAWPNEVAAFDGFGDQSLACITEASTCLVRASSPRQEARGLCGDAISRYQSIYCTHGYAERHGGNMHTLLR